MAKKSLINKEEKKINLYKKFFNLKNNLKLQIKQCLSFKEKWQLLLNLQCFPKNSSIIRQKNRCILSGKPRAFLRRFGLCRIKLRELAMNCEIPGLIKSSW